MLSLVARRVSEPLEKGPCQDDRYVNWIGLGQPFRTVVRRQGVVDFWTRVYHESEIFPPLRRGFLADFDYMLKEEDF